MEEIKIPSYIENIVKDNPIKINLYPSDMTKTFNSFRSFYEFLKDEYNIWSRFKGLRIERIKAHYNAWISNANSILKLNVNENEKIINQIKELELVTNQQNPEPTLVFSETEFGKYILEILEKKIDLDLDLDTLWNYLFQEGNEHNKSFNLNRPLVGIYSIAIRGFEILNNQNKRKDPYPNELELLKKTISKSEETRDAISSEMIDFRNQREEITNLYKERLRIEGPASYWEKFRKGYIQGGSIWVILSVGTVTLIILTCIYLLKYLPDQLFTTTNVSSGAISSDATTSISQMIRGVSIENAIRWTILLALIFSALIFLLRLFVKLAISAFHLSRDANERLQLTHQYLALLKEGVLEEKQRAIILQSLFSRADTGLLKGDSSPAFPPSLVTEIASVINGK